MYVRDKSPGAYSEVVAEELDAVYNGDLDDGDWTVADLESTPGVGVASRAKEIRNFYYRIQQVRWEAEMEVPHSWSSCLAWARCQLLRRPITTPRLNRPVAQRITLREVVDRCRKHLLNCKSKLVADLNYDKAEATELQTSLNASRIAFVVWIERSRVSKKFRLNMFQIQLIALLLISSFG